jgi:hypothetical protein
MSEPTREEKIRTIKIARKMMENLMAEYADDIKAYRDNLELLHAARHPAPAPVETPEEQAALERVLNEVRKRNAPSH